MPGLSPFIPAPIASRAALWITLVLLGGCASPTPGTARAPGDTPVTLDQLGWLLGAWRGTGGGEEFFETYRVLDDSTFAITYYTDSTCTAVRPVTGTVEERGRRIYHTYGNSRWVVTGASPTSLFFEPIAPAKNRFRWVSERPNRWTATLMQADSLGRETTATYTLQRLDADDTPGAEYQDCARAR